MQIFSATHQIHFTREDPSEEFTHCPDIMAQNRNGLSALFGKQHSPYLTVDDDDDDGL